MIRTIKNFFLVATFITVLTGLFGGQVANAIDVFTPCSGAAAGSSVCQDAHAQGGSTSNPVIADIKVMITILSVIIGVASVIIIIVSGIRMAMSGGDVNAAASARSGVIYAVVGIAIAAIAQAIVVFVLNKMS